MRHDEFADRAASRLEFAAAAMDEEERGIGHASVSARANEMRVAARMIRDMSEAVSRAEESKPLRSR